MACFSAKLMKEIGGSMNQYQALILNLKDRNQSRIEIIPKNTIMEALRYFQYNLQEDEEIVKVEKINYDS